MENVNKRADEDKEKHFWELYKKIVERRIAKNLNNGNKEKSQSISSGLNA
jgi:hypothetical protein